MRAPWQRRPWSLMQPSAKPTCPEGQAWNVSEKKKTRLHLLGSLYWEAKWYPAAQMEFTTWCVTARSIIFTNNARKCLNLYRGKRSHKKIKSLSNMIKTLKWQGHNTYTAARQRYNQHSVLWHSIWAPVTSAIWTLLTSLWGMDQLSAIVRHHNTSCCIYSCTAKPAVFPQVHHGCSMYREHQIVIFVTAYTHSSSLHSWWFRV